MYLSDTYYIFKYNLQIVYWIGLIPQKNVLHAAPPPKYYLCAYRHLSISSGPLKSGVRNTYTWMRLCRAHHKSQKYLMLFAAIDMLLTKAMMNNRIHLEFG